MILHSVVTTEKTVAVAQGFTSAYLSTSRLIAIFSLWLLPCIFHKCPPHSSISPPPCRISWVSTSLFTDLLGPCDTIKPNYPINSLPLSPPLPNALDKCTSKHSSNVTCHLTVTSTHLLFVWRTLYQWKPANYQTQQAKINKRAC